jgi:hypothetical protein
MRCHSAVAGIVLSACVISLNSWKESAGTRAVQAAVPAVDSPGGFVVVATHSVPDSAVDLPGPRAFPATTDSGVKVSFTRLTSCRYRIYKQEGFSREESDRPRGETNI